MDRALGVITFSKATFELFSRQIGGFYDNTVSIEGFYLQDGRRMPVTARPVLVSVPSLMACVKQCLRPDAQVFFSRRTVDLAGVVPLFDLPRGTRVLVANMTLEAAEETVDLLKELGLDDLAFTPHWPQRTYVQGEADAVAAPQGVLEIMAFPGCDRVINIGMRPLDLSTVVEVGVRLGLSLDKAKTEAIRQMREVVALSKRQRLLVESLNEANERLKTVIDSVHDGIIGVDASGIITLMNSVSRRMLGIRPDMIGRPAGELPGRAGLMGHEGLIRVGGKDILTSVVKVAGTAGSVIVTRDVTEIQRMERDVREKLRDKGFVPKYSFDDIIGSSKKIRSAIDTARKLAATDLTVLIVGENGTGKELFAHAIHGVSPVKDGPFIAVNSSALPEGLVESELFGYEEGAFTGARRGGRVGLFEQADNGTIFLDEVGDLPQAVQIRLLRVMQERDIMRIGADRVIPVNVRVIAATNRNLLQLVKEGRFRKDLYYRLCLCPLRIPALRERKEDIDQLLNHFLRRYGGPDTLPPPVLEVLRRYDWPGNVRELEGVVRYLVCVAGGELSKMDDVLDELLPANAGRLSDAEEFRPVEETLQKRAPLQEYRAILAVLIDAGKARARYGRTSLHQEPRVACLGLTPHMVRLRIEAMEA
ncbi:MAG: sigma 54-interacting transcriptional regulator, partial [Bacillota bacterium]